jgi:hypothetical protein
MQVNFHPGAHISEAHGFLQQKHHHCVPSYIHTSIFSRGEKITKKIPAVSSLAAYLWSTSNAKPSLYACPKPLHALVSAPNRFLGRQMLFLHEQEYKICLWDQGDLHHAG